MARLKQIESFVATAARGSLTAAAQAEGVAPAVIGRRIDALEERLGVKLLVRTTRRISLTPDGAAYYEHSKRILADGEESDACFHEASVEMPHSQAGPGIAPFRNDAQERLQDEVSRPESAMGDGKTRTFPTSARP